MIKVLYVLRKYGVGLLVLLLLAAHNFLCKFRKKKVSKFDETELYNPKIIDNGPKRNTTLRVAGRRNIHDTMDQKL